MTIFLGAFLLFFVQPLLGKVILPAFGGTPAVWLTCLCFFQLLLLLAYVYAFLLARLRSLRWQGALHLLVLAAMLLWLPLRTAGLVAPGGGGDPAQRILLVLATSIAGPFLVLGATGPLLQSWYVRRFPGRSPYRLYALSNAGSLLALLAYPLLVEPSLALDRQGWWWSAGLLLYAIACGRWALQAARTAAPAARAAAPVATSGDPEGVAPAVSTRTLLLWLALATCGSALLLATTGQITQNVAAVPLLWVVPLALYLLTYILAFDHPRWTPRGAVAWMLAAALPATGAVMFFPERMRVALVISVYCFTLFAVCLACHGELARLAPPARKLTLYYVLIAAGGALGGLLVTLVAPHVFDLLLEYPLSLVASVVTLLVARRHDPRAAAVRARAGRPRRRRLVVAACVIAAVVLPVGSKAVRGLLESRREGTQVSRNFYGVLVVAERSRGDPVHHQVTLTHGTTLHGVQFTDAARRGLPTTYYGPGSGVDVAIAAQRARMASPLAIGVVGMGAGTIAAYATAGDRVVFYEINPAVVDVADRCFTFRRDAEQRGAAVGVELGDARLVLQRQLDDGQPQGFDVLVVDAFSSDAIPVHLLTDECLRLYEAHLAPNGILAFHVSSRFLDLAPVVRALAGLHGRSALSVLAPADAERGTTRAEWVLVADDAALRAMPSLAAAAHPWPEPGRRVRPWTDDYSSLWPLLR